MIAPVARLNSTSRDLLAGAGTSNAVRIAGLVLCLCLLSAVQVAALAQQPEVPPVRTTVDVVAVTPVGGLTVDPDRYPANVQRLSPEAAVTDSLDRQAASLQLSEAQSNEMQPDVQLRGFVLSPLLGAAQGIAVFQDGARLNEPFGDTINWDAVPDEAISEVDLIPGSNAAFGLNALGGVISLRTKTGFSDPGVNSSISGGTFQRFTAGAASGWHAGSRGYFVAANGERDGGWREFSPSRRVNVFGSASFVQPRRLIDLRLNFGAAELTGNGAAPIQLLDEDRNAVFTHPDETHNRILSAVASSEWTVNRGTFSVTSYVRRTRTRTLNGDESAYEECEFDGEVLCLPDGGETVIDEDGRLARITPEHPLDAVMNRTSLGQTAYGLTVQSTRGGRLRGTDHRVVLGLAFDGGIADFASWAELADLQEDREVISTRRVASDSRVDLATRTETLSLFAADVVDVTSRLSLVASARLNHSKVRLDDRLGVDLNGSHTFTAINPAVGATLVTDRATFYLSVGQSSRIPTPVELTCADPDDPCRLPNAFLSDPPLEQVVARTIEAGVRGERARVRWSLAAFRTANRDDILFISSGEARGEGYFANVGSTRRDGIELMLSRFGGARVQWFANYSLLDATFGETFSVASPHHPAAQHGDILVRDGDRLPLIPRHTFKAGITWRALDALSVSPTLRSVSRTFFRGDEGNLGRPLPGYTVVDLAARYNLSSAVSLRLTAGNVFDAQYATFGTYGDPSEVLGEAYDDPRFISPGEPRNFSFSIHYSR